LTVSLDDRLAPAVEPAIPIFHAHDGPVFAMFCHKLFHHSRIFLGTDFEGMKDICAFVKQAQTLGLMVILRPSVYICAEWEFGGLPAWLLNEPMRLRSTDPRFMAKVRNYFQVLLSAPRAEQPLEKPKFVPPWNM